VSRRQDSGRCVSRSLDTRDVENLTLPKAKGDIIPEDIALEWRARTVKSVQYTRKKKLKKTGLVQKKLGGESPYNGIMGEGTLITGRGIHRKGIR